VQIDSLFILSRPQCWDIKLARYDHVSAGLGFLSAINYPERFYLSLAQCALTFSFFVYLYAFSNINYNDKSVHRVVLGIYFIVLVTD